MVPGILCRKREAFLGKPIATSGVAVWVVQFEDHRNPRLKNVLSGVSPTPIWDAEWEGAIAPGVAAEFVLLRCSNPGLRSKNTMAPLAFEFGAPQGCTRLSADSPKNST